MSSLSESQLRLVYSLMKPVVRAAARFHIPVRTLTELLRLAYFETLRREGLSQAEIGKRLGQTERHMRSFEQRLKGDFFAAEHEVGLVREIENYVASNGPREADLRRRFSSWDPEEVTRVVDQLLGEVRIARAPGDRLRTAHQYVLLASDQFHKRIDALNHFLEGAYLAIVHRLVFDRRHDAMIKTISFSALPDRVHEFLTRLEAELRREVSLLEQDTKRTVTGERRYMLGLAVSPAAENAAAGTAQAKSTL